MRHHRCFLVLAAIIGAVLLAGCAEETSDLKQKMAELEKRVGKQEKEFREFSAKVALPRDFSADIQRIEDQQDRIGQAIKTKLDPVNSKLEEFRDWAQEAEKERDEVRKRLKGLEESLAETEKKYGAGHVDRLAKALVVQKKQLADLTKNVTDVSKGVEQLQKELRDNNAKIVEAVKKTLPKVKDAAVAELKDRFTPLEQGLNSLKAGMETDRKAVAELKAQGAADASRPAVQTLNKRLKDLEEVLTAQKAYMLELGTKIHELELQLRRSLGAEDYSRPGYSRR